VRRTKAQGGGAHEVGSEVHLIMDGSGTFVTGGTVVRATGQPGTIEGGTSRHVQKGDVVLVPGGTPHWYKDARRDADVFGGSIRSPDAVK
jgi:mannose-6-phosphate isomerase-like protein (cupin superfamily)